MSIECNQKSKNLFQKNGSSRNKDASTYAANIENAAMKNCIKNRIHPKTHPFLQHYTTEQLDILMAVEYPDHSRRVLPASVSVPPTDSTHTCSRPSPPSSATRTCTVTKYDFSSITAHQKQPIYLVRIFTHLMLLQRWLLILHVATKREEVLH